MGLAEIKELVKRREATRCGEGSAAELPVGSPVACSSGCGSRIAALCIAVETYLYLSDLEGAVRDAGLVNTRLESVPACTSRLITHATVTSSNQQLSRCVQTRLEECAHGLDPPDVFLLYYAGYVVQNDQKVYLVPGGANPKEGEDLNTQCLSLDKVLNCCRKDLEEPVRTRQGKSVKFVVLLDACRRHVTAHRTLGGRANLVSALACELGATAPAQTSVVFSCSRKKTGIQGREGASPFARSLLDAQRGAFVDGMHLHIAIANLSGSLWRKDSLHTEVIGVGLDAIPKDFCIVRTPPLLQADMELKMLLREWKLEGEEGLLVSLGLLMVEDLEAVTEEDAMKMGLSLRFRGFLQHLALLNNQKKGVCWVRGQDTKRKKKPKGSGPQQPTKNNIDAAIEFDPDVFENLIEGLEEQRNVGSIITGMKVHKMHYGVQEAGCWALWFLAADDDIQAQIADLGGIEQIVEALTSHPNVVQVQEAGCGALWNLAANTSINQVHIASAGGIDGVLSAMLTHPTAAGLQYQALGALTNLVANKSFNKLQLVNGGGIDVVVAVMKANQHIARVQEQACALLSDLALKNQVNKVLISESGGIERVVAAMSMHPAVVGVQEQACRALASLAAGVVETQDHIAWAGGIERSVAAMSSHPRVISVQVEAVLALRNVASNSLVKQAQVAAAGGIESVVRAIMTHPLSLKLQQAACALLLALATSPNLVPRIKAARGVEAIKQILEPNDIGASEWRPLMAQDFETQRTAQEFLSKVVDSSPSSPSSPLSRVSGRQTLSMTSRSFSEPLPSSKSPKRGALPDVQGASSPGSKHSSKNSSVNSSLDTSLGSPTHSEVASDAIGTYMRRTGSRAFSVMSSAGRHLSLSSWS